jgi:AcrR family transcriptional regulator
MDARDRLLVATAQLTYERGVEATGVDAIAKRAGVTKRTLYQRFGSKAALVAEALRVRDEPAIGVLRAAVERRIARGSRPVDALFAVLTRLFAREDYRGCAFVRATLEVADPEHPLHAVAAAHVEGRRALVHELVRAEGVEDDAVAEGVLLLVEGAFTISAARADPGAAERAGRAARALLDGAVRKQA